MLNIQMIDLVVDLDPLTQGPFARACVSRCKPDCHVVFSINTADESAAPGLMIPAQLALQL